MIHVDGTQGGGQLLRTSLSLSAASGQAFRMSQIRGKRSKPGLLRQHLTCVRVLAQICQAEVEGAELGSTELVFRPGTLRAGSFETAIGSAGSANLVLQTAIWPLALAPGPSTLTVKGGTHNGMAPSTEFLRDTWLPQLAKLGVHASIELREHGFFPAGGGEVCLEITPSPLQPAAFEDRPEPSDIQLTLIAARISKRVLSRLRTIAARTFRLGEGAITTETVRSRGPGLAVELRLPDTTPPTVFVAFGHRAKSSEQLIRELRDAHRRFLSHGASVTQELADQLLVGLALTGGSLITSKPSEHLDSEIALLQGRWGIPVEVERGERLRLSVTKPLLSRP